MERQDDFRNIGEELGYESVERGISQAEKVCMHERRRIELASEAKIVGLRAELALWMDEDKRLGERLRTAPPPGDRRSRRLKAYIAVTVTLVLMIAGFFLSLLALAPFRLGTYAYLLCVGIALVCPYCVERFIEEWDCRKLIKVLATVACIAAIASLVLLAEIRGKLFAQEFADAQSEVVINGASADAPQNGTRFYQDAIPLLQLMMALLALAMELGAGLAFHDAMRLGIDSREDAEKIAHERVAVRQQMASLMGQTVECANEGAAFEERFWRDFYRAVLTHASRKALGKLLALSLCCLFVGTTTIRAAEPRLNLVILIDLSASVATKGPDGRTDFQKNVVAVTDLLGRVPAGTKLTVLGITGDSFQEPDILLSAQIAGDPGYFGERLAAARGQLVRAWQQRAGRLAPDSKQTDIFGALLVASQIFATMPNSTGVLVIYSDMRQATSDINLARLSSIRVNRTLAECARKSLMPKFRGIEAYILGVDATGTGAARWNALRRFWSAFFRSVGVNLRTYSIVRGLIELTKSDGTDLSTWVLNNQRDKSTANLVWRIYGILSKQYVVLIGYISG